MVWASTPFLLDYRRNTILDLNTAGLNQAWGRVVPVRYILWQHDRYADRPANIRHEISFGRRTGRMAARSLDVFEWINEVVSNGQTIGDSGGMVLVRAASTNRYPPN